MAKRFHEHDAEEDTKVDISPLIDCVFILLIFFIVTTTFVDEKGFSMETPQPSPPMETDEEPSTLVFEINERGQVLLEGQVIGLSGVQPAIRESKDGEETPIIVTAIGDVAAELPVRVFDECRLTGAKQVSLDHRNARN